MRDIVIGSQEVRIIVRLEIRTVVDSGGVHELILIRVDDIDRMIAVHGIDDLIYGILLERIVMVREENELSLRHPDRLIGIAGDSGIDRKLLIPDPRIALILLRYDPSGLRRSTAVRQTDLNIPVGLAEQAFHKLIKKTLRRIEERDHDTDERHIGKFSSALTLELFLTDHVVMEPVVVAGAVHRVDRMRVLLKVCLALLLFEKDLHFLCDISELILEFKKDRLMADILQMNADRKARAHFFRQAQLVIDVRAGIPVLLDRKNTAPVTYHERRHDALHIERPSADDDVTSPVSEMVDVADHLRLRLCKEGAELREGISLPGLHLRLAVDKHRLIRSQPGSHLRPFDRGLSGIHIPLMESIEILFQLFVFFLIIFFEIHPFLSTFLTFSVAL